MARVLVAGATGYLGGFVAREAIARGHRVRLLARSPDRLSDLGEAADEVVVGQVTEPDSLEGVCDGIDVVFSSVGITRQKDGLTFRDVDYQGNRNLLDVALTAGVRRFVYVATIDGSQLEHLAIVKAHEDLVRDLKASDLAWSVLRPTGYFSDMGEIFDMARKGRAYLFGPGAERTNPIHGADLAVSCVDAFEGDSREIDVGGPDVLTWRAIAELAFEALGKPPKISSVPVWLAKAVVGVTRWVRPHQGELLAFFTTMATRDVLGPPTGTHTLAEHFRRLAEETPEA